MAHSENRLRTRVIRILTGIIPALLIIWYCRMVWTAPGTWFDDAFMYLRYAGNILAGHGFSWNPGDGQVYGVTSIAYAGIVTMARALFPTIPADVFLTRLSGLTGLLAMLLCSYAVSRGSRHRLSRFAIASVCVMPFFLFVPAMRFHALSGMETMLSIAANSVLIIAMLRLERDRSTSALIITAIAAWFAVLVRPDNGLFAVLAPAFILWIAYRSGARTILMYCGILAGLLILDSAIKFAVFGDVLPLSHFVKQRGFYDAYAGTPRWNPVRYLTAFLYALSPYWAVLILTARRERIGIIAAYLVPVALTAAYYFRVIQIMGDNFRFYAPAIPFIIVPALICLDDALGDLPSPSRLVRRIAPRIIAAGFCLTLVLIAGKYASPWYRARFLEPTTQYPGIAVDDENRPPQLGWTRSIEAASRIAGKLPPGSTIAATEIGRLAAENPHVNILDLSGLHDARIAQHGFSVEYLLERSPDLIWLPHPDYTAIVYSMISSDSFQEAYLFLPGILDYGIALRRDSSVIRGLVLTELEAVYGAHPR
jgi:hypothetical protein